MQGLVVCQKVVFLGDFSPPPCPPPPGAGGENGGPAGRRRFFRRLTAAVQAESPCSDAGALFDTDSDGDVLRVGVDLAEGGVEAGEVEVVTDDDEDGLPLGDGV